LEKQIKNLRSVSNKNKIKNNDKFSKKSSFFLMLARQYFSPPPRHFSELNDPKLMTPQNNYSNAPYLLSSKGNGIRNFNQEYRNQVVSRSNPNDFHSFKQDFNYPPDFQYYQPNRNDFYNQIPPPNFLKNGNFREGSPNEIRRLPINQNPPFLNHTIKKRATSPPGYIENPKKRIFDRPLSPTMQNSQFPPVRRDFPLGNEGLIINPRFQEQHPSSPQYQPFFNNEYRKPLNQPLPREGPFLNPMNERFITPPDFYPNTKIPEMTIPFEKNYQRFMEPPLSSTLPLRDDYIQKPILQNPYGIRDDFLLKPVISRDYEDLMPYSSKIKPKIDFAIREMPPSFLNSSPKFFVEEPNINFPTRFTSKFNNDDFLHMPASINFPVRDFSFQPTIPLKGSRIEEPKKVHLDKDYDEIADALKEYIFFDRSVQQSKETVCRRPDFKLIRLIKEFDDNETGQIVFTEFKNGLKKFGVKADDPDIMLIINRYSRDGDKKLE